MKLYQTRAEGRNLFTGYGAGYVSINERRYEHHVVVAPQREVMEWAPESFDALTAADLQALLELRPEIVLLGTGERLRFPPREVMRALSQAAVGLEVMDTGAAARTYNILMSEGRQVIAAIFVR